MMTQAHSQNLPASTPAWKHHGLATHLVDRATALELRRTTMRTVRDKSAPRTSRPVDLTCPPTIRTMDHSSPSTRPSPVPVVIVSPAPPQGWRRGRKLNWGQIKLDLSWMAAAFVALSVTLALAIPLELLRQHG
jgi:hypothetical protein